MVPKTHDGEAGISRKLVQCVGELDFGWLSNSASLDRYQKSEIMAADLRNFRREAQSHFQCAILSASDFANNRICGLAF
ncbi:hypothetical protein AD950_04035 [Gluconobacter oxydans]|nr:hypothetical protein AD950_04035 [Gluconobacter oxydans]